MPKLTMLPASVFLAGSTTGVIVCLLCASLEWQRWLHSDSATPHEAQVNALVSVVLRSGRIALAQQLDWYLALYRLRRLLVEIEGVHSFRSRLFPAFLAHTYATVEATKLNQQLQRLSNWFHIADGQPAEFFAQLCAPLPAAAAPAVPAAASPAAAAPAAALRDHAASSQRSLSKNAFELFAPLLPRFTEWCAQEGTDVIEQLRRYLHTPPTKLVSTVELAMAETNSAAEVRA